MKLKGAVISFFGLALLLALSAQEPSGTIGWYNGDWKSGMPSHPNWYLASDSFARVYSCLPDDPGSRDTKLRSVSREGVPLRVSATLLGLMLLCGSIFAADFGGVWTGRITIRVPREMPRDVTLTLKTEGSSVTGTLTLEWDDQRDSTDILDGRVIGEELSFAVATGASDMPRMNFQGKQDGNELKLTVTGKSPSDGQELKLGDGLLKRVK